MSVEVACQCGQRFAAASHLHGQRVACPACGGPIDVPTPGFDALPPVEDPLGGALPTVPIGNYPPSQPTKSSRFTSARAEGKIEVGVRDRRGGPAKLRDAIHRVNEPSRPRWTKRSLDLSQLQSAELILQPFGDFRALEHVMLSFRFSDGRHVVVSMEARRTSWASFDTLAGFFRHDQIYPIIGTERDLIWKRLARDPPFEMQFYPLAREPAAVRAYFETTLAFANQVTQQPQFYGTIRESCLTTLIRLAPQTFAAVPWYDIRKWIPGYSLSLFQDLGLVNNSVSVDELARLRKLRSGIQDPADFPDDPAWSAYLRRP